MVENQTTLMVVRFGRWFIDKKTSLNTRNQSRFTIYVLRNISFCTWLQLDKQWSLWMCIYFESTIQVCNYFEIVFIDARPILVELFLLKLLTPVVRLLWIRSNQNSYFSSACFLKTAGYDPFPYIVFVFMSLMISIWKNG